MKVATVEGAVGGSWAEEAMAAGSEAEVAMEKAGVEEVAMEAAMAAGGSEGWDSWAEKPVGSVAVTWEVAKVVADCTEAATEVEVLVVEAMVEAVTAAEGKVRPTLQW